MIDIDIIDIFISILLPTYFSLFIASFDRLSIFHTIRRSVTHYNFLFSILLIFPVPDLHLKTSRIVSNSKYFLIHSKFRE
uniref:Neurotransmitter-gated ion-channel ligand-binding domain-containing protein n=1 Tax=Parascaris univalens TaxID=6257 RepID=A0A915BBW5_PARUN